MTLKLLEQENLDLIRAMIPLCAGRLGRAYFTLLDAIEEAESVMSKPVVVLRRECDEFEVGLRGYRIVRLRQRPNSNALGELHQVLAAAGKPVALPGSSRAIRARLAEAIERVTREAGAAMLGNVLEAGLHVGKDGAWFDYQGLAELVTD